MTRTRFLALFFLTSLVAILLAACGDTPTATLTPKPANAAPIVISSKPFTENILVAEIYAQILEDAGLTVERKFKLGQVDILNVAIQSNTISLYPDYTGTLYLSVLRLPREQPYNPRAIYDKVATAYDTQYKLAVLEPAPMNNTFSLAVSKETADKYKLRTMSDLAPKANLFRFITTSGWVGSRSETDGLKAFQNIYGGYSFKELIQVADNERYKKLQAGEGEVVLAYSTDGEIAGLNLVLLDDDKGFFMPYQMVPVVRQDVLANYPNVKTLLNTVSARLTSGKITAMNWKIDGPEKADYTLVAKNFLKTENLIK